MNCVRNTLKKEFADIRNKNFTHELRVIGNTATYSSSNERSPLENITNTDSLPILTAEERVTHRRISAPSLELSPSLSVLILAFHHRNRGIPIKNLKWYHQYHFRCRLHHRQRHQHIRLQMTVAHFKMLAFYHHNRGITSKNLNWYHQNHFRCRLHHANAITIVVFKWP